LIEPRDAEQSHGGDDLAFEYFEHPGNENGVTRFSIECFRIEPFVV